ncbi:ROK family protein [Antarcticibacterium flavum]|uniref:ROK family protein n=1 Tax=Antarcticibacterium flavum TaxID=2058175 RepID=A0A5B7X4U7_9FLAO|nr:MULTISPECIES: ROK family transcriptional regulator [Antarcticibacterium]MCM4160086.1 sugar kinase [Antarcticibacterium sp. W02-3]QCY69643.1 ROK family protein [Antarcticibacterium flavum]
MGVIQSFLFKKKLTVTINKVERKNLLQKIKILKYLYFNGPRTNSDICNVFKMSLPTSMNLLNQLQKEKLVVKKGLGNSAGGRRPDLFGLDDNTFLVLSIHIERFKIRMAIINNTHQILFEKTIPIVISANSEIVDMLHRHAQDLISESEIDTDILMGVGVSMPGLISIEEGRNLTYFLKDQETASLQSCLEKKFFKPVVIFNDANSACLAEFRFGLAKNKKDVLVVSMDWGIGLGIIMGGQLQTGTSGFAGEFGHIPVVENGALCYCGKTGCLETIASGIALVKKAEEKLRAGHGSVLGSNFRDEFISLEPSLIIKAANEGDQFAINLLTEIGTNLGKGLAILIQIFNPEEIILGGQIAEARQFITTPVQQSINMYCKIQLKEDAAITLSELGKKSSLLGVTLAVMEGFFSNRVKALKNGTQ